MIESIWREDRQDKEYTVAQNESEQFFKMIYESDKKKQKLMVLN